jgi:hypothetical protein
MKLLSIAVLLSSLFLVDAAPLPAAIACKSSQDPLSPN